MPEETARKVCPLCNGSDSIQRLSAIVASGTATGTFSGPSGGVARTGNETGSYTGYTTLSGTTASNLARSLSFPAKPSWPRVFSPLELSIWAILVIASFGIFLVPIVISIMIMPMLGWDIKIGQPKDEYAKYMKRMAEWITAKPYWSSLYYCHKDGIVFDPSSGEYCQPEQTSSFTYQHIPSLPLEHFTGMYDNLKRQTKLFVSYLNEKGMTNAVDKYLSTPMVRS